MNYLTGVKLREMPPQSSYLRKLPVIRSLYGMDCLEFKKSVTFLVGENGTGKSTLLEGLAVAMGFNAEGGSRDFRFSTRDTHSDLYEYLTLIRKQLPEDGFFLRAESFYNTATYLEDNSSLNRYGGVSFHDQSHGEAFLALVTNRFEGHGLYLLDEPEAALSPQRLMELVIAIHQLVKQDSQFIISTHSPILMAYPNAEIFQMSEDGIRRTNYRETEHYKLTKQFLDMPERMMQYLLEEE